APALGPVQAAARELRLQRDLPQVAGLPTGPAYLLKHLLVLPYVSLKPEESAGRTRAGAVAACQLTANSATQRCAQCAAEPALVGFGIGVRKRRFCARAAVRRAGVAEGVTCVVITTKRADGVPIVLLSLVFIRQRDVVGCRRLLLGLLGIQPGIQLRVHARG